MRDGGIVVGTSRYQRNDTDSPYHAFLWENGKMTDLNEFLPSGSGLELQSANDISLGHAEELDRTEVADPGFSYAFPRAMKG